jgi:hypothetical protein
MCWSSSKQHPFSCCDDDVVVCFHRWGKQPGVEGLHRWHPGPNSLLGKRSSSNHDSFRREEQLVVFLRAKVQKSLQLAMLHKERLLSRPEEAKVAGLDVDADCKIRDEIDDCEEEEEEEL